MYLTNAFSLNMVDMASRSPRKWFLVDTQPIPPEEVPAEITSAIDHPDTARLVSSILGRHIPANRVTISLGYFDECILVRYVGPRLPEGSTTLPEGASLSFFRICILPS